jgi:hypothetical protein
MRETVTPDSCIYVACHHFLGECNGWGTVVQKSENRLKILPIVFRMKGLKRDYSRQGFWHSGDLPIEIWI